MDLKKLSTNNAPVKRDKYGKITEAMCEGGREKLAAIKQAVDLKKLNLNIWENNFIKRVPFKIEARGLSFKESSILLKIYARIT